MKVQALRLALLLFPLLAGSGAVLANGGGTNPRPCKYDRERFCHDVEPGSGALARCLWKHRDELTPACRKDLEDRAAERHKRD